MVKSIARKIYHRVRAMLLSVDKSSMSKKKPEFANIPQNFNIVEPFWITNAKNICMGDDVALGHNSILKAQDAYPRGWMRHPQGDHVEQTFDSRIYVGNRVTATASLQVIACREVIIEDDVMFASNVFICDALHGYERGDIPYKYQGLTGIAPIYIKRGCWIGQNVVVLPGVTIGEYCIIGANSVVNKSIPDRSIAVGSPARVIKQWNSMTEEWEPIESK